MSSNSPPNLIINVLIAELSGINKRRKQDRKKPIFIDNLGLSPANAGQQSFFLNQEIFRFHGYGKFFQNSWKNHPSEVNYAAGYYQESNVEPLRDEVRNLLAGNIELVAEYKAGQKEVYLGIS